MSHFVICRICKQRFDTEKESATVVGARSYYHTKCYEEWRGAKSDPQATQSADFWYEAMIDYLYRDVRLENMDFQKILSQWNNFLKTKKYTPKGIYFAIKYFYDVEHGDKIKSLGGIGIVPSIYTRSAEYWVNRENQKAGTLEEIIKQIQQRETRPVKEIIKASKKPKQVKWDLNSI